MQTIERPHIQPSDVRTDRQFRLLVVRAFILLLPFALFLAVFEWRFRQTNPSHYAAKKILLEQQLDRVQAVVMGSSHAYVGINPAELPIPAFNLANNSQTLFYDAALLEKYIPRMPALKLVILPVSYFSLEAELDEMKERWRCYYYSYFFSLPHRDWHMAVSTRNYCAWFLCGSEISRAGIVLGRSQVPLADYDPQGGIVRQSQTELPSDTQARNLNIAAEDAIKRHHSQMNQGRLEGNIHRLKQIITAARNRGVRVVLVTLPVSKYYQEKLDPERYTGMQNSLNGVASGLSVPYWNFLRDAAFDDSDFQDADHLNGKGASRFTRLLSDRLRDTD